MKQINLLLSYEDKTYDIINEMILSDIKYNSYFKDTIKTSESTIPFLILLDNEIIGCINLINDNIDNILFVEPYIKPEYRNAKDNYLELALTKLINNYGIDGINLFRNGKGESDYLVMITPFNDSLGKTVIGTDKYNYNILEENRFNDFLVSSESKNLIKYSKGIKTSKQKTIGA